MAKTMPLVRIGWVFPVPRSFRELNRADRLLVCCLPEASIENNHHLGERMASTTLRSGLLAISKGMSAQ